jgi:hypothetical protein
LFHLGDVAVRLEHHHVVGLAPAGVLHLALVGNLAEVRVVGEGDMVGGVPVKGVAAHGEGTGVQHQVYRPHHLRQISIPG